MISFNAGRIAADHEFPGNDVAIEIFTLLAHRDVIAIPHTHLGCLNATPLKFGVDDESKRGTATIACRVNLLNLKVFCIGHFLPPCQSFRRFRNNPQKMCFSTALWVWLRHTYQIIKLYHTLHKQSICFNFLLLLVLLL